MRRKDREAKIPAVRNHGVKCTIKYIRICSQRLAHCVLEQATASFSLAVALLNFFRTSEFTNER